MDPTIGEVIFGFFGLWFGLWFLYQACSWCFRLLRSATFRMGRW